MELLSEYVFEHSSILARLKNIYDVLDDMIHRIEDIEDEIQK